MPVDRISSEKLYCAGWEEIMKKRIIAGTLMVAVVIAGLVGCQSKENTELQPGDSELQMEDMEMKVNPGYRTVTEVMDWGPAITKVILNMDVTVDESMIDTGTFLVSSKRKLKELELTTKRNVLDVYVSDAEGSRDAEGTCITIEMEVGPDMAEGSPFNYDFASGLNQYVETTYLIQTAEDAILKTKDGKYLTMDATDASDNRGNINVIADTFDCMGSYSDEKSGITLTYASYIPEHAKEGKTPLIIWLHGAGEGGTDPTIAIMGNKVVNLATEDIQQYFGETGAEILAPQTATMWMDNGEGKYMDVTDADAGTSYYTEALMDLIEEYVSGHNEIDTARIYIGGCSNGGYMTLNMLIEYPEYFAAGYPVCEAYEANWLNDEKMAILKDIPIWMTAAKTDTTVSVAEHSSALYEYLTEAGAQDIHYSLFENVVDTSGKYFKPDGKTPYEYNGHWSWIYTLNNECVDEIGGQKVSVFEWLAQQSR